MHIEAIPAWVTATNAYLVIGDTGQALLVDAPPDPDAIGRHIAERGVAVTAVLLTHGHIDHTGGAGKLTANAGAVAYVHPEDDFLTFHPTDQLKRIFGYVPPGSYELPERIERLEHGQMLTLAGITLEVRHTPGHTPGHCCFYSDEEGVLFSGDQLFAGSIGRTDLPGGSYPQLMDSMREQVMVLDDGVRVLPGHGPETSIGRERSLNPFRDEWA